MYTGILLSVYREPKDSETQKDCRLIWPKIFRSDCEKLTAMLLFFLPIASLFLATTAVAQQFRSMAAKKSDRSLAGSSTGNLLSNGDAETHICTNDWRGQTPVPGWKVIRGAASVLCYSAFDLANETATLPSLGGTPGLALFGAPGIDTALTQMVNIEKAVDAIDSGSILVTLSGWLGGWRYRPERAVLTATFWDSAGRATGSPVVVMGPSQDNLTALFYEASTANVPPGTRSILVTLDLPGSHGSYHNSYADNLSLQLQGVGNMTSLLETTPAAQIPASSVPQLDHVFLVMMENTNYADIVKTPVIPLQTPIANPVMPDSKKVPDKPHRRSLVNPIMGPEPPPPPPKANEVMADSMGPQANPPPKGNPVMPDAEGPALLHPPPKAKPVRPDARGPETTQQVRPMVNQVMPFFASLASQGVLLTDMWGTYHPSDQNYVAMVSGNTYKYGPVYFPDYNLTVPHLGDLLNAKGLTWKAYAQSANGPCDLTDHGFFYPDDEPFVHFFNVIGNAARCNASILTLNSMFVDAANNDLPNFAWVAANDFFDGEAAWYIDNNVTFSLQVQDQFLKMALEPLLNSSTWANTRSLIVVVWDESLGWGWPDNHVASAVVASQPGILQNGQIIDAHYDGYGVLRTIEEAFQLGGFGLFDQYAKPMNEIFVRSMEAGNQSPVVAAATLTGSSSESTAGNTIDSYGMVATPVSAVQGTTMKLIVYGAVSPKAMVVLTPLGSTPSASSPSYAVSNGGVVSIPTSSFPVGMYAAWLLPDGKFPVVAPLPVTILPPGSVQPSNPGVEIASVWTPPRGRMFEVREGGNLILHYCRPANVVSVNSTWIGIVVNGTDLSNLSQNSSLATIKTPEPCGYGQTYTADLEPGPVYHIIMGSEAADGTNVMVGKGQFFTMIPGIPA